MENALFINAGRCLIAACKSDTYTQKLYRIENSFLYKKQEMSCIDPYMRELEGFSIDSLIHSLSDKCEKIKCNHVDDELIIGGRSPDLLQLYSYSFRRTITGIPKICNEQGAEMKGKAHQVLTRYVEKDINKLQLCVLNERGARVIYSSEIRFNILPEEYGNHSLDIGRCRVQAEVFNSLLCLLKTYPDNIYTFIDELIARWD